jgi:hypothetical protein
LCRRQPDDARQHVTLLLRGKPPFEGGKPCFERTKAMLYDSEALAHVAHFVRQLADPRAEKVEG